MKSSIIILGITLISLNYTPVFSQTKEIDSLKLVLTKTNSDTGKINILNELSYCIYMTFDYETCLTLAKEALALSEKNNYDKGKGYALINIACYYLDKSNFPEAIKYLNTGADLAANAGLFHTRHDRQLDTPTDQR